MKKGKTKLISNKKRRIIKVLIILALLTFCIITLFSYFKGNVLPVVTTMGEATVKVMGVNAINSASQIVLNEKIDYDSFVTITKDVNDKIQMIQANTVLINRLTRELATLCQSYVEKIEKNYISLPLGAFSGSAILNDIGPEIEIPLLPIGSVTCNFASIFEEVGINQTRHSIYININTVIAMVLPISSVPVSINTSIMICDNIIVGEVPKFYFNNSSNGSKLDLLPKN